MSHAYVISQIGKNNWIIDVLLLHFTNLFDKKSIIKSVNSKHV